MEIIVGLLVITFVVWLLRAALGIKSVPAPTASTSPVAPRPRRPAPGRESRTTRAVVEPVSGLTFSATISGGEGATRIRPDVTAESCWFPSNREVTIAGRKISGGLL